MNKAILEEELAPLNAQIEQVRQKRESFENELRIVEKELDGFSANRQRFETLQDVCDELEKLTALDGEDLFWEGISEVTLAAGHLEQVRERISGFEREISGFLEKQTALEKQIKHCEIELHLLYEEVQEAYDREERRKEEYIIEREMSSVPLRTMVMPWTKELETERRFRRAVVLALLLCVVLGGPIPLITVPIPDRSETAVDIPERLVKLVKKEPLPRAPVERKLPETVPEEPKGKPELAKKKPKKVEKDAESVARKKTEKVPSKKVQSKAPESTRRNEIAAARKKVERVGVLAFKDTLKDLMKETPVAKLGAEARLSKGSPQVAGKAVARRSLVSIQAENGPSGGIGDARVSRNIGNGNVDRLGGLGAEGVGSGSGIGIGRVASNIANLEESARPVNDGLLPGRTDEEIQIVFDRYKAALYRIYNKELRKDPTLRGKILMRIIIEESGVVSMCEVESTDLESAELVTKIVARIKRFNFGPKDGVPPLTILYPIDFLPAG